MSSVDFELSRPSVRAIDNQTPGVTGRVPCSIFRSRLTEIAAASANSAWVMRRTLRQTGTGVPDRLVTAGIVIRASIAASLVLSAYRARPHSRRSGRAASPPGLLRALARNTAISSGLRATAATASGRLEISSSS